MVGWDLMAFLAQKGYIMPTKKLKFVENVYFC